jgi:ribosomal protein L11 methyltransferase
MGCGTGILAILASLMGAKKITAIDYDRICFDSAIENAQLNNIQNITALCGSKEAIPPVKYDLILANINRNILLDQLPEYSRHLNPGGSLFMSGFYEIPDLKIITEEAARFNLLFVTKQKKKEWVAARFKLSS